MKIITIKTNNFKIMKWHSFRSLDISINTGWPQIKKKNIDNDRQSDDNKQQ